MLISLNLNSSALRHVVYESKNLKIDIHVTTLLIILLIIANNLGVGSLNALFCPIIVILAYLTLEIPFLLHLLKTNARSEPKTFCLYPFGILHDSNTNNEHYQKQKFILTITVLTLNILYTGFDPSYNSSLISNTSALNFENLYFSVLMFLSLVNALPLPPLPGMLNVNRIFPNDPNKQKYFSIAAIIFLLLVTYQYKNLYMLIMVITICMLTIREGFNKSTLAKSQNLKIKDFYATLGSFVTIDINSSVKNSIIQALKHQQTTFPVFKDGELAGFLFKDQLIGAIGNKNIQSVKELISIDYLKIQEDQPLTTIIKQILEKKFKIYAVFNQENLKGFLVPDNLVEAILLRDIMDKVENQEEPFDDEIF